MSYEDFMFFANRSRNINKQETLSMKKEMRDVYNMEFENESVLDEFDILIETDKAEIVLHNFEKEIKCLLDHERMKEKVYNSLSLGIKVHHNVLKVGDFITQRFKYSPESPPRNYIVRSLPQIKTTHDYSFLQVCQYSMKLLDKSGSVIEVPVYFEDNRTRLEDRDTNYLVFKNSRYQLFTQDNETTRQLDGKIKRIMVDGKCYEVTGTDTVVMKGLIYIGLNSSDKNYATDNFELGVADYYILKEEEKQENYTLNYEISGNDYIYYGEESTYSFGGTSYDWTIEGSGVEIVEKTNSYLKIKALDTAKYLGETIKITCHSGNAQYIKEVIIRGF